MGRGVGGSSAALSAADGGEQDGDDNRRPSAAVLIRRRRRQSRPPSGGSGKDDDEGDWEVVRARGHLDEVVELLRGGTKLGGRADTGDATTGGGARATTTATITPAASFSAAPGNLLLNPSPSSSSLPNSSHVHLQPQHPPEPPVLVLTEGPVLGRGAFSRVCEATEQSTGRRYALKRMPKKGVLQCPEHVYCERLISKNVSHPFCVRQYASFQDDDNLYLLLDLMSGGDLMDVLVAEAKVVRPRVPTKAHHIGCLAPRRKMLRGLPEPLARFYVACVVLALEHLHNAGVVYRDLKPENVFLDAGGWVKLGDFGFAKALGPGGRTYTFCGTPGYVAPENVLAHGYGASVDWWGLGVLTYVLLTGRQPFSSPRTDDPMAVMRRIVDERYSVKYPPYVSASARDFVSRLLERKPAKRLGMLQGRAADVKRHRWFVEASGGGFDWGALERRAAAAGPPRRPKAQDAARRLKELAEADLREQLQQQQIGGQAGAGGGADDAGRASKRHHHRDANPSALAQERAECDAVFADF